MYCKVFSGSRHPLDQLVDHLTQQSHRHRRPGPGGGATAPFKVGSSTEFAARRDGRLWLRVNDAGIENNSGEFNAHVQVPNRPAA